MSRLVKKLKAAIAADAFYQREEARETLAMWQAQDTSTRDYREHVQFENELAEAADRVYAPVSRFAKSDRQNVNC